MSGSSFNPRLATRIGLGGSGTLSPAAQKWLDAVASDLTKHSGASLVVAGEFQPAEVHALAHAINAALGNVGTALYYTEPVEANPVNQLESFTELCADIDAGKVNTLLIFGSNPVYDAPHDFDFTSKLNTKSRGNVRAGQRALRRNRRILQVAYRRISLSGRPGACLPRVRWHHQRDSAAYLSALPHALCFRGSTRRFLSDKPGLTAYDAVRNARKTARRLWRSRTSFGAKL